MTGSGGLAQTLIRSATVEDAEAIAQIHVSASLDAYSGILPGASIEFHTFDSRVRQWRERLTEDAEGIGGVTLVGEVGGEVMGFIDARPGRGDTESARVAEVSTVYVDAGLWRHGLGAELMHAAMRDLAHAGFEHAYLYVFADNERACQFYEALGWTRDADESRNAGGPPEVRFSTALRAPR